MPRYSCETLLEIFRGIHKALTASNLYLISLNRYNQVINIIHDDAMISYFCGIVDDERCLVLFPAGTIIKDSHHRKFLTHQKQDLNLLTT